MTRIKRIKKTNYIVDGIEYKTKTLADAHTYYKQAKKDGIIDSFELSTNKTKGKYHLYKPVINDMKFDSLMEANYYIYISYLLKDKQIKQFERQVPYVLQKGYTNKYTGKKISAIKYIADFVITYNDNTIQVIDVKGKKTTDFKLKEKMFGFVYPEYEFKCVQWSDKHNKWMNLDNILKEERALKREKAKARKAG